MLLLHYLGVLERELAAVDLHALVFPVLSLQLAVAGGLLPDGTPLTQLLHMRCGTHSHMHAPWQGW